MGPKTQLLRGSQRISNAKMFVFLSTLISMDQAFTRKHFDLYTGSHSGRAIQVCKNSLTLSSSSSWILGTFLRPCGSADKRGVLKTFERFVQQNVFLLTMKMKMSSKCDVQFFPLTGFSNGWRLLENTPYSSQYHLIFPSSRYEE